MKGEKRWERDWIFGVLILGQSVVELINANSHYMLFKKKINQKRAR